MFGCHDHYRIFKNSNIVCNKNQAHKAIIILPICLTDYDHEFIPDEIKYRDTI